MDSYAVFKKKRTIFKDLKDAVLHLKEGTEECKKLAASEPVNESASLKIFQINHSLCEIRRQLDGVKDKIHDSNVRLYNCHADFQDLIFEMDKELTVQDEFLQKHGYKPATGPAFTCTPHQGPHPDELISMLSPDPAVTDNGQNTPIFISLLERERRREKKEQLHRESYEETDNILVQEGKESSTPTLQLKYKELMQEAAAEKDNTDDVVNDLNKKLENNITLLKTKTSKNKSKCKYKKVTKEYTVEGDGDTDEEMKELGQHLESQVQISNKKLPTPRKLKYEEPVKESNYEKDDDTDEELKELRENLENRKKLYMHL